MRRILATMGREIEPSAGEKAPRNLFLEMQDLDAIVAYVKGIDPVASRRRTFYGADEIFVREPAGHIAGFARF